MKKILLSFVLSALATASTADVLSVASGVGRETINNTLDVDLYQVGVNYAFGNGVLLGGSVMKGYPDSTQVSKEDRYETYVGYVLRYKKFASYITVSRGLRYRYTSTNMDYYTVSLGYKYAITNRWNADVSYRYRDTDDANWQTDTYFVGLGYAVTPTTTVQTQYGKTSGSYKSDQLSVILINRF
jgi:opacity protein-like surface antigen